MSAASRLWTRWSSMAPGAQTLVDHLQQWGVLQSSCHSLFVCQLFVHWKWTKKANSIFYNHKNILLSSDQLLWPTCFLWSVRPRSDVNINLRTDGKGNIQDVCILKKKKMSQLTKYTPWTCLGDSEAAWLWWTGRWALPCCSGGWWVWTQCPRCCQHHSPAKQTVNSFRHAFWSYTFLKVE